MTSLGPPGAVIYPAAERNKPYILECLQRYITQGTEPRTLLEIGAGTGQHAVFFAPHFPQVTYQPTELEPRLLNSIEAFRNSLNLPNLKEAAVVDVTQPPSTWLHGSVAQHSIDYMLSVNMVHIAPWACAEGLFRGAAHLLKPGGYLFMYGPFAVDGQITPESNVSFDKTLRGQNAEWGLRDMKRELEPLGATCGLSLVSFHDLPANNKFLAWLKQSIAWSKLCTMAKKQRCFILSYI